MNWCDNTIVRQVSNILELRLCEPCMYWASREWQLNLLSPSAGIRGLRIAQGSRRVHMARLVLQVFYVPAEFQTDRDQSSPQIMGGQLA